MGQIKESQSFVEILTSEYLKNPCGVQATALWKTLKGLENFNTSYEVEDGEVSKMQIHNENALVLYWINDSNKFNTQIDILREGLQGKNFVLIQDKYIEHPTFDDFKNREPYFRLIHHHEDIPTIQSNSNYSIVNVDIENEAEAVATFIGKCYDDMKPTPETVRSWTNHPVFKEDLWIWVVDNETQTPAGLGIAELDESIPEGSLEWIQVLPEYHGRGIGKIVVSELLQRLKPRAKFTTVSGRVDNKTNPEALYRKCGFTGNDIWWALRKE